MLIDEDFETFRMPEFINDDVDNDVQAIADDASNHDDELFDCVCAFCDNGGDLLCCEGRCMRAFHATVESGEESLCASLGLSTSDVKAMRNFLCRNCEYKQHQCYACGKLGSSDTSSDAEVFKCINATCGHFYHPQCVAKLVHPKDESSAHELEQKIASGESFACPIHKCRVCQQGENKRIADMQFAFCRRCPVSYHRKCLPNKIVFEDSEGGDTPRAWEGLLPNRLLIYCLKHEIDENLATPARNHVVFPDDKDKKMLAEEKKGKLACDLPIHRGISSLTKKRRFTSEGLCATKTAVKSHNELPSQVKKVKVTKEGEKPSSEQVDSEVGVDTKFLGDHVAEQNIRSCLPSLDADTKQRLVSLLKEASLSITLEDILRRHKVPSSHACSSKTSVDKAITMGKVEGAIGAVRTALKKLDDGCIMEDATAVCEPQILHQISLWQNYLKVYLAPFLYGKNYASFGRHFTKVEKLQEIVDMLHWYVHSGDMIVDFCCGANDFSCLMKKKLEEEGKKCFYKNYDCVQAKNDFNFERRDWMRVGSQEVAEGRRLIIGLSPPFGRGGAGVARKFVGKALTFEPKLLVLVVPPEAVRLDEKKKNSQYDLVWENRLFWSKKSFHLPESVGGDETVPVLYLWSRSDWTEKHKAIAREHGHLPADIRFSPFLHQSDGTDAPVSDLESKSSNATAADGRLGESLATPREEDGGENPSRLDEKSLGNKEIRAKSTSLPSRSHQLLVGDEADRKLEDGQRQIGEMEKAENNANSTRSGVLHQKIVPTSSSSRTRSHLDSLGFADGPVFFNSCSSAGWLNE